MNILNCRDRPLTLLAAISLTSLLSSACERSSPTPSDRQPMAFQLVNARAMQTVLHTFRLKIRDYEFTERPFCADTRASYCAAHSIPELKAVHTILQGAEPRRGFSFVLSPVRDSGAVKVVQLITSIVGTPGGAARGHVEEFVLDREGTTVLSRRTLESF